MMDATNNVTPVTENKTYEDKLRENYGDMLVY